MLKKGEEPIPGYVLEKSLGHGAFGVVWRARGPGNTHCALKFISLDAKSGHKELRAIQRVKDIRHANLLSITAFWILDDEGMPISPDATAGKPAIQGTMNPQVRPATLIIAMPLGDKNLADRLAECVQAGQSGVPIDELLEYTEEAAKAIDFLNTERHDLGDGLVAIQHCDIKPANIMIVGSAAQVCDFGLARVLGARNHSTTRGASGTPAYMAPEVIVDERPTATTDQYSLALTYYELRTGRLPFGDVESLSQVLEAHTKGGLDFAGLSAEERAVVARGAHRTPTARFPSTLAFARALRSVVSTAAVPIPKRVVVAALIDMPAIAGTLDLPSPPTPGDSGRVPPEADVSRSTASIRAELVETHPSDSRAPTSQEAVPASVRPRPASSRTVRNSTSGVIWVLFTLVVLGVLGCLSLLGFGVLFNMRETFREQFHQVVDPPYAPPYGDEQVPGMDGQRGIVPQPEIVPPPAAPPLEDVPSN